MKRLLIAECRFGGLFLFSVFMLLFLTESNSVLTSEIELLNIGTHTGFC
jgi:hypothetical protein